MPLLTAGPSRFLGGGGIAWLLRDEFTTDRAAGAVNGTAAEPGPGTRTVVDTQSYLSISGGKLLATIAGAGGWGNPSLVYAGLSRVPGRFLVGSFSNLSADANRWVGWGNNSTPGGVDANTYLYLVSGTVWPGSTTTIAAAAATAFALPLRATGCFFFSYISSSWKLIWRSEIGTVATMYPAFSAAGHTVGNVEAPYIRVPDALWLPTPLVSDGFATTFGTSDGLGHAEGIATGIGAGGGGVAWTGATWSVSGGKAVNTPVTFGAERLTDGAFENWGSATDLTSWTETIVGTTTINREGTDIHGGTYAVRIDVDASNSSSTIAQAGAVVANKWYRFSVWAKSEPTAKSVLVGGVNSPFVSGGYAFTVTNSYLQYVVDRWTNGTGLTLARSSAASSSIYIDDVSVVELTLSELISSVSASTANVVAGVAVTVVVGRAAGLCLNLDSASSPANFVLAYHDMMNACLLKCVAGVYTSLIATGATYSAGARLVVTKDGTAYRLYYNNALVGTEQTIADAGIISNTLHGLFSTDASNTLDDFVMYARGNEGQYASLDRYSGS